MLPAKCDKYVNLSACYFTNISCLYKITNGMAELYIDRYMAYIVLVRKFKISIYNTQRICLIHVSQLTRYKSNHGVMKQIFRRKLSVSPNVKNYVPNKKLSVM